MRSAQASTLYCSTCLRFHRNCTCQQHQQEGPPAPSTSSTSPYTPSQAEQPQGPSNHSMHEQSGSHEYLLFGMWHVPLPFAGVWLKLCQFIASASGITDAVSLSRLASMAVVIMVLLVLRLFSNGPLLGPSPSSNSMHYEHEPRSITFYSPILSSIVLTVAANILLNVCRRRSG